MNSVNLIGNLALDPEMRQTASGKDVCTIRLAVTRRARNENGVRESDFINVQCWEQAARFVGKFLKKGDKVAVQGEFRERQYTDKNGQKRYTIEVSANSVESVGGRRDEGETATKTAAKEPGMMFTEVDDDDLPF